MLLYLLPLLLKSLLLLLFLMLLLLGLPADGTIAAAVAYTMRDLHQERASLDYPIGWLLLLLCFYNDLYVCVICL